MEIPPDVELGKYILQEFFQIVGHFKDELERRMQLQDINQPAVTCGQWAYCPDVQDLNLSISDLQETWLHSAAGIGLDVLIRLGLNGLISMFVRQQ